MNEQCVPPKKNEWSDDECTKERYCNFAQCLQVHAYLPTVHIRPVYLVALQDVVVRELEITCCLISLTQQVGV